MYGVAPRTLLTREVLHRVLRSTWSLPSSSTMKFSIAFMSAGLDKLFVKTSAILSVVATRSTVAFTSRRNSRDTPACRFMWPSLFECPWDMAWRTASLSVNLRQVIGELLVSSIRPAIFKSCLVAAASAINSLSAVEVAVTVCSLDCQSRG